MIQGLGLGLVFVPLSTLAFATLEARFRTDATSLFSLTRNLGSSVGISMVMTLLAQNAQVNHAVLAEHVTPFNPMLDGQLSSMTDLAAVASLNAGVPNPTPMRRRWSRIADASFILDYG